MKWKNETKFHISGLNQEKMLNELSKSVSLKEIERNSKSDTTFKCSYLQHHQVEKFLKSKNVKMESIEHEGFFFRFKKLWTSYGLIAAFVLFGIFFFVQNQFILQYQVTGVEKLSKQEVVQFVKQRYSNSKHKLDTKQVEVELIDEFECISFASCIIRGQTLVINIKEKLMPDEMYGEFKPIIAQKDAKITKIDLISGTVKVQVGDIVRKGDILVEPFTIDASGEVKKVEAKAEILADVYNRSSVEHLEKQIEIKRTGKVVHSNEILLFGLPIYTFKEEQTFALYEVENEELSLVKNLLLPFKIKKTTYYELTENMIESKFEDVKDVFIEKAKQKTLEIVEDCDKIKEEFYTLRHISGVTYVNYCIITQEIIGNYLR